MTPRRRWWLLVATVAMLALLVVLAGPAWIRREIRLSVTCQPTRYTELYFTQPTKLPARLPVRESVPVRFTIANHEGTANHYRYGVITSAPRVPPLALHGDATVRAGAAVNVVVPVKATRPGLAYTVTVRLPDLRESIHSTPPSSKR